MSQRLKSNLDTGKLFQEDREEVRQVGLEGKGDTKF